MIPREELIANCRETIEVVTGHLQSWEWLMSQFPGSTSIDVEPALVIRGLLRKAEGMLADESVPLEAIQVIVSEALQRTNDFVSEVNQ